MLALSKVDHSIFFTFTNFYSTIFIFMTNVIFEIKYKRGLLIITYKIKKIFIGKKRLLRLLIILIYDYILKSLFIF